MSDLITNLNSILSTKLEIKDILKTESDVFSDYPAYIEAAIAEGGGVSGYSYIVENGDYNIAAYAMVNVNVPPEQIIPDGYTYVHGGKEILQNGENIDTTHYTYVDVHVPIPAGYILPQGTVDIVTNGTWDVKNYENAYVTVEGEIPPGYIIPAGEYVSNISEWVTIIDDVNPSEMTAFLISPDVSEYETIALGLQGQLPQNASYVYENGLVEVNPLEFGQYNSYIYVDVPVPAGYTYVSGSYSISYNGNYNISSYEYAYVNVSSSVSGTLQMTYSDFENDGNGNYVINKDVSSYAYAQLSLHDMSDYHQGDPFILEITENGEYLANPIANDFYNQRIVVDVPSGPAVESYTWTNVPASGNYRVAPSAEYYGLAFYVYKSGSTPWSGGKWTQILSDRQFAYTLPSSFTANQWTDYATNTYLLESLDVQNYVYSCDPSNYNSLTDINNIGQSSNEQEGKFELECHEMYGDINLTGSSNKLYPAGGDVHYFVNLKTINDEQGRTGYLTTGAGLLGYIPETSYFGTQVPYTYLNGRSWETIVEIYQDKIMLKDIVGPVAGSEVYLNECDDVWANWMSGWNGGTTTYNTSTGNLELTFSNNYIVQGNGKNANIYQLEYRIENGGSNHMIGLSCDNQATIDSTHLTGTTYISAGEILTSGGQTGQTGTNFGYIDEADFVQEGYTNYDVDFKLVIPRDMWLYGSSNFNTCWVEWTITPDSSALADDVTALQTAMGTSWSTGNRVSGSGSDGYWSTTVTKSNKSTSNLENYKIYEINVTGTTSGTHNFVPDLNSPDALSINNLSGSWEGPLVAREDQNGKQMFTLDTTDLPGTANLEVSIRIPEKVLDPDNSEYMTCHIDYEITY